MGNEVPDVLLAEDNAADVYLIKEALRVHQLDVNLHVVSEGEAAIRFIEATEKGENASPPKLALLDINLPRRTGIEVLTRLRRSTTCGAIPVALMSSSRSLESIGDKIEYFFTKPCDYDGFMALGGIVKDLLTRPAA